MSFTQPICESCYAAWSLGHDGFMREPTRLTDEIPEELCCICETPTRIFFRVDPKLVPFPSERED